MSSQTPAPTVFPPRPPPPTPAQLTTNLRTCLTLQTTAVNQHSKRPFYALLMGPDHSTILLTHASISHVEHAESCLARLAALHFSPAYLWSCTLYSTWEPCAMCAGTIYWANIGRVVYAASEEHLKRLTGEGNEDNFTMSLGCRVVLASGQKDVQVFGPFHKAGAGAGEEGEGGQVTVGDEVVRVSDEFWKPIREAL
ncbi:hypothetical protein AAFC00_003224 [Neodothiora populina]|uniref:CMP/dCMP-type deaminase domain-containing protein n=1 Tax=Neodothiora populina TaxID=2781224 RepID=A0ABR3PA43_9PEZI